MIALTSDTFSRTHIALTAGVTGVIVLGFAMWLRGQHTWIGRLTIAVLVTAAVFLW